MGCRRCQQRGIQCVYDSQKSRGGSNSKQQEGASAEAEHPETSGGSDGSDQQPVTVVQGSGHPWDNDVTSSIQAAIPSTAPAPKNHSQDQKMSSGSDAGPRSGGGSSSSSSSGSSSNRSNRVFTRQNRPQDQQETFQQGVLQTDVAEQSSQPVAPCPEDPDLGFFLDFTEEFLNNTHDSFAELLSPFDADGLLSHNHMQGKLQLKCFVSLEAHSLHRMLIRVLQ